MKEIAQMVSRKKRIAVVLGGGGARGLAHIGVLKALEENRIPITMVVGSSIGALIGGLYSSGVSVAEMETLAREVDKKWMAKIMVPRFFSPGLIDNRRVFDFIRDLVGSKNIEQSNIPFAAVATDYATGKEVVLTRGPLTDAIMSSIAIPMIFQPVYLHDRYLLDGGLSNPLPVSVALEMNAQRILAVNVSPGPEQLTKTIKTKRTEEIRNALKKIPWLVTDVASAHTHPSLEHLSLPEPSMLPGAATVSPSLVNMFMQSVTIATNNLVVEQLRLSRPDVLLSPKIEDYDTLEFHRGREIIQRGYDAAINEMPLIRSRLSGNGFAAKILGVRA